MKVLVTKNNTLITGMGPRKLESSWTAFGKDIGMIDWHYGMAFAAFETEDRRRIVVCDYSGGPYMFSDPGETLTELAEEDLRSTMIITHKNGMSAGKILYDSLRGDDRYKSLYEKIIQASESRMLEEAAENGVN